MTYDLETMKSEDIRTVNFAELIDISTVKVNTDLPPNEKIRNFIEQVKNPYFFRVDNIVVKTSHAEEGESITELVQTCLLAQI